MDFKEKLIWGSVTLGLFLMVFLVGVMSDVLWFRPDIVNERVVCPRYVVQRLKGLEERIGDLEGQVDSGLSLNDTRFRGLSERVEKLENGAVPRLNFSNVKHISLFSTNGEILVDVPPVEESGVAE